MSSQDPLAHLCPLCGQSNACHLAEQPDRLEKVCNPSDCWCQSVQLTEQTRRMLKTQTNGKRCLCQACLQIIAQMQQ